MLIPAFFVADSVNRAAGPARPFETIVFTAPSEVPAIHRQWMSEHDIIHSDALDTSPIDGIGIQEARLTSATLMKLLLPRHLAERYDKVLYLDADLTIHDDISSIFSLDTGATALAAVPSGRIWADRSETDRRAAEEHFRALGMTAPYRYFNTGVILIDVDKWNRDDLGGRALGFIREHPGICRLPDEDALNAVLDGRIADLSPIWGMRPLRAGLRIMHRIACPVIVHHAGEHKPWRPYGYGRRLFEDRTAYRLYESFLAETPWDGWLDEQWSGLDLYKSIVWEVRRVTRRLRGTLDEPSRRQRRAYVEAVRNYLAQSDFVDVAQGITVRSGGSLRLKGRQASPN
jgi:lipopolysaccharide biosynthesis glycosyltransferase